MPDHWERLCREAKETRVEMNEPEISREDIERIRRAIEHADDMASYTMASYTVELDFQLMRKLFVLALVRHRELTARQVEETTNATDTTPGRRP